MKKASAKKEAILKAALELFAEQGFAATTTKDISLRSGVAEGLMYYYFRDKRELLREVIRTHSFFEAVKAKQSALLQLEGVTALEEYASLYLSFLQEHSSFLLLVWSPELLRDEEISQEVGDLIAQMVQQAAVILSRAAGADSIRSEAVQIGASMLLSSLLTYAVVQSRMPTEESSSNQDYIHEVIKIVVRGLSK
ncbi:TetR/AcrR family transcriptional regulator [Paenibacillus sp. GD4]|uniref:TetR/AcrR family transcriptional regulator n=1 Tax=Paenibacillus sp. GD4 TaxID=3068890 RepID=UPI002796B081|nr:TetR/AcrR family transcriptional regulator [Paenibacillus sp. GD4]MDQ1909636.1 TetR/AcrR family transcriptional regulator [Paenibacillus sp. GD4]